MRTVPPLGQENWFDADVLVELLELLDPVPPQAAAVSITRHASTGVARLSRFPMSKLPWFGATPRRTTPLFAHGPG
jgi:hypothetical protein